MRYNLSELTDIIEDRRTIYPEQFSSRKVHKEIISKLLNAAKWAPTHKLTQPWNFTVFMDKGTSTFGQWHAEAYKNAVSESDFNQKMYTKIRDRAERSAAVIVVAMKRDDALRVPEIEEIASTAAAIQNMALLATAYGLGFYWGTGGMAYSPEMKTYLGLGENDKVMGMLFIGYPEIEWPRKTPRRPIEYFSKFIEE
ncbi:MAG: nitroreductase [Flavobacteriales bacterium]|nr:nitroreductase [Flavobacteriales bacterium]